jgi:hypothetical protein
MYSGQQLIKTINLLEWLTSVPKIETRTFSTGSDLVIN